MDEIFSVFAVFWDDPNWTIPWAGIGALLLGLGSTFSGIAAIITARAAIKGRSNDKHGKDSDTNSDRDSDGGGKRVPDIDGSGSGSSSAT